MSCAASAAPLPVPPRLVADLTSDFLLGLLVLVLLWGVFYLWQRRHVAERHARQLTALNEALRESEEALRQSEERFRRAFEDGPVGILLCSPSSRVVRANRALCQMLGHSENELLGFTLSDLGHPEDVLRYLDDKEHLRQAGKPLLSQELRFVTRDRTVVWARVTTTVIAARGGELLYELSHAEDVTTRKRTEEILRQSEERFYKAFHANPIPVSITTFAEGRFIDVNESFLRLTGYGWSDLMGRSMPEIDLWPEPEAWASALRRLETEGSIRGTEGRLRTRAGELREVLAALEAIDLRGERCLLTLLYDITDRKRAEEEVRRSEDRFQLIARATNDTVWDWDLDRGTVWWNEGIKTVFGHADAQLVGDAAASDDLIHPEDRHRVTRSLQEVLDQGGRFWSAEYRFRRADGAYADVLDRAYVIQDPTGRPVRMIGAMMDITERNRFLQELATARDAAVEALRLKSEFLANISHEVRTPLNGIVGMTVLLQDTSLTAEQRSYVETIQSSTDALLTIINDILDFSKMEAGKLHFETLDFELRNTLDTTIEILADRARYKHLELVCLVDEDVPDRLRGDPGRLRQVMSNLVVNAIKFTERGEVVVQVTQEEATESHTTLLFTVRDSGIGIPKDALPYLFQAFSQVDGSTTRKHGGTGLGLSICKQLVEFMGGQIGVESTLGVGSTFWFTVRLEKQSRAQGVESVRDLPELSGTRILVAEDHEATRRLLLAAATSLGSETAAAGSAAEALGHLREAAAAGRAFALAILDTEMADATGLSLARAIRSDSSLASTRLVLLAPRGPQRDTGFLRASGISALLTKPVRQRYLIDCLARLLGPSHDTRFRSDRPEGAPGTTLHTRRPTRPVRILVAEDNPINQRVALALLAKLGQQAQAVASGPEVLRAFESVAYDIVFMDCQLPEIDGFETTRELRRREKQAPTPMRPVYIIAMTAFALPGARERCIASGMNDYLSKPVRLDELSQVLQRGMAALPPLEAELQPRAASPPPPAALDLGPLETLRALREPGKPDPVAEVVTMFLRYAPTYLRDLEVAIVRYDAQAAERAAHTFKGSALTLGARRLADLCHQIETEADKGSLQVAGQLLNQLRVELSRVRDELRALPTLTA